MMVRKKRQPEPNNSELRTVLLQELASIDLSLEQLSERETRIQYELQTVQSERRQNQELREHARALLENQERNDGLVLSSAPEPETSIVDQSLNMDVSDRSTGDSKPNTSDTLSQAVYETLKDTEPSPGEPGVPMHYRDLVAALESRKIYVSGHDRGLNLVAHIHKNPNFVRPKRGMYGLKDWYPETQHNVGKRSG
jgi:hypothetical protein